MADKQYVYAVARIRSKELSLLSGAFLEQLTAAKDYDECIQLLMEKGWGEDGMTNAADILAIEKRKMQIRPVSNFKRVYNIQGLLYVVTTNFGRERA